MQLWRFLRAYLLDMILSPPMHKQKMVQTTFRLIIYREALRCFRDASVDQVATISLCFAFEEQAKYLLNKDWCSITLKKSQRSVAEYQLGIRYFHLFLKIYVNKQSIPCHNCLSTVSSAKGSPREEAVKDLCSSAWRASARHSKDKMINGRRQLHIFMLPEVTV